MHSTLSDGKMVTKICIMRQYKMLIYIAQNPANKTDIRAEGYFSGRARKKRGNEKELRRQPEPIDQSAAA
jgi:hypothetical protein